ncbi:GbsR/MarR family transcriptional regulator [Nocardia huaxiensis]|uniref:Helix-turn-helix domain-containing protein n=1 Tax=Nocardia huaxiensis TaxID=2755382 RepID=A0A7D6ZFP1_9NOCA|nr:helix-turn-helix domain-containing protein [Nocardia huaxiensis]QLY32518.1 helix-turn-helix domain-containing protein [Nocardia huaxiensis]UFS93771.1 helix-turn-helix domain-containing protein [Nocardia huaxiensis]
MPGGRLTPEDRRRIAAGLAQGLGYAEIARELGRPTSTVSREVGRNGGPGGYRADLAHAATVVRSRRRTARPKKTESASGADEYGRSPEAVAEFGAQFAELLARTGVPKMPAAVLARLYAADSGSVTAAELVRHLRVSPATVSAAVGYLEGQELIRRERDPGTRRDRYFIDESAWYRATLASARNNELLAARARAGAEELGIGTPAGMRLLGMSEYLDGVARDMVRSAEQWHAKLVRRLWR